MVLMGLWVISAIKSKSFCIEMSSPEILNASQACSCVCSQFRAKKIALQASNTCKKLRSVV